MLRYGREKLGKITLWFRRGGTSDRNGQSVDGEGADNEGDESNFREHDDGECREEEQIIMAPGLRFGR